jgi:hypothetical protein
MVPGAKNMGMGITLPFEDGLNEHVTPELAFEFHYFFTRKFWMVSSSCSVNVLRAFCCTLVRCIARHCVASVLLPIASSLGALH